MFPIVEREVLNRRRLQSQAEARMPSFSSWKVRTIRIGATRRSATGHPSATRGARCSRAPETRILTSPRTGSVPPVSASRGHMQGSSWRDGGTRPHHRVERVLVAPHLKVTVAQYTVVSRVTVIDGDGALGHLDRFGETMLRQVHRARHAAAGHSQSRDGGSPAKHPTAEAGRDPTCAYP